MAAFLGSELSGYALLGAPVVGPGVQDIIRWAIVPTTFTMLLTAVFYFATASRRAEARLDGRNRAMRLVLDHVDQGLLTIEPDGRVLPERSAAVERWFGPIAEGASLVDVVARHDPRAAEWLALGLAELREGLLPVELLIDQLPRRFRVGARTIEASYKPIEGSGGRLLVVLTDITAAVERAHAEEQQREVVALVTRALGDRGVLRACLREATSLAARLAAGVSAAEGPETLARDLHTLKGNAALFGIGSVARLCHRPALVVAGPRRPQRGRSRPRGGGGARAGGQARGSHAASDRRDRAVGPRRPHRGRWARRRLVRRRRACARQGPALAHARGSRRRAVRRRRLHARRGRRDLGAWRRPRRRPVRRGGARRLRRGVQPCRCGHDLRRARPHVRAPAEPAAHRARRGLTVAARLESPRAPTPGAAAPQGRGRSGRSLDEPYELAPDPAGRFAHRGP
jgi:PAS domain-containing protein